LGPTNVGGGVGGLSVASSTISGQANGVTGMGLNSMNDPNKTGGVGGALLNFNI